MEYTYQLLETEKKKLEARLINGNLMHVDMKAATKEMCKIAELKFALKLLKEKEKQKLRKISW